MKLDTKLFAGLTADPAKGAPPPLQVLFEDNHLLVVFKPHRLLIQGDKTGHLSLFEQICAWLKEKYQKPGNVYLGMVHRLDRPAGGIVVFAKTSKAASRLSEQFRTREVGKVYEALVQGTPAARQGHLRHYLTAPEEGPSLVFEKEAPHSKRAELEYRLLGTRGGLSLVEVELLTGRRHQIRAQMASIGCPLLGDGRYGATEPFIEGSIALVSRELAFEHPTKKETLVFKLPEHLSSVRIAWNEIRV